MADTQQRDIFSYLASTKRLLQTPVRHPVPRPADPKKAQQQREEREKREQREDFLRLLEAVKSLYHAVRLGHDQLETTLRRRGHLPIVRGKTHDLLLPLESRDGLLTDEQHQYMQLFGEASFRKLAMQLIAAKGEQVPTAKLEATAGKNTAAYLAPLLSRGVAVQEPEGVRLTRPIVSLGHTLECYVAQLCRSELYGSAEWAVELEGVKGGGDYDVLSWLDPALVYIELKSGRPANIGDSELRWFLERTKELAPDLAILLVDTRDSLAPLVRGMNEIIEEIFVAWTKLPPAEMARSRLPFAEQADYGGIFFGFRNIYVTNSKPTILEQMRRCLRHYHAHVKGEPREGVLPYNFVTRQPRANPLP